IGGARRSPAQSPLRWRMFCWVGRYASSTGASTVTETGLASGGLELDVATSLGPPQGGMSGGTETPLGAGGSSKRRVTEWSQNITGRFEASKRLAVDHPKLQLIQLLDEKGVRPCTSLISLHPEFAGLMRTGLIRSPTDRLGALAAIALNEIAEGQLTAVGGRRRSA
ncbi:MAG: hypothetical protein QOK02_3802, partial [Mycobacterium sp.]|nr:hypothetical protein [Mycobacterium sp.]